MDKFLTCEFKESRKASYFNNKLSHNVSNYGASANDVLFVGRNGEYLNISIQIIDNITCLFNDVNVHKIYLNIESNYINNFEIINKFNLVSLYQKYQNEIFRFIVDTFLELNEIKGFYLNYPIITNNLNKDIQLNELVKIIKLDNHELIQVGFKVVNCGSLLPESWLFREFKNGKTFHNEIDKLECRINKPPVTYLCNYSMLISQQKIEPNISEIKDLTNVWLLSSNYKFKKIVTLPIETNNLTWISVEHKDKPIYIIFNKKLLFNEEPKLKSVSISYNCSLLQKSIRRGIGCNNSLIDSIDNLSTAKPFNNPEYNYTLVSGSKQLVWRLFISIIEDVCIFTSESELDIFDLVAYSKIFMDYPEKNIHPELVKKIKILGTKLQFLSNYKDFRLYKPCSEFNITNKYHLALFIAHEYMPGMSGDKNMIKCLETWLNKCDNGYENIFNLDTIILNNINIKNNTINDFILRHTANDHHCNPEIISIYHNLMYDGKITLKDCSTSIWNLNSSYNYRLSKFRCNRDLLLIQLLYNNNYKSDILNTLIYNKDFRDISNPNHTIMLSLIDNLIKLNYEKIYFVNDLFDLKLVNKNINNTVNYNNIIQILLSNSYNNTFIFNGKKTTPVFTFDRIKFKIGDTIYSGEEQTSDNIYKKIFTKYTASLNNATIKLDKYALSLVNFNKSIIKLGFSNNNILFDNKVIITVKDIDTYTINTKELEKYITLPKMINYEISQTNNIHKKLKLVIEQKPSKLESWIIQEALSKPDIKDDYIIHSDLLKLLSSNVIKILISRILTSLDDKNNKTILFCGKVNRSGNSNKEAIDTVYEGYLMRILNVLNVLYGCFKKVSNTKYEINKKCTSFTFLINDLKTVLKNNTDNKIIKTNQIKIKTKLWGHQEKVRNQIITCINNFNQRGFGDASEVGSGKTLTALSVIEALDNKTKSDTNFLVLIPNDNLFKVWNDEIKTHCENVNIHNQVSNGKWTTENINNSKTNIWITTMGRNRDHPKNIHFDFVIIDECLTVQNKDSKWTMSAFEQAVGSKYGILMLSATFFRTRFDKLFFMLKMLESGIPEKSEYLDTILNTIIGANIKVNKRIWTIEYNKVVETDNFYKEYNKLRGTIKNKMDSYIEMQTFMKNNIDYVKLIITRINELLISGKKVVYFAQSTNEIERLEEYIIKNKINNIGVYPNIDKDACIISIHSGSYGINNLIKYNSILLRPTEPDKIPQIKGRIDRPNQINNNLYLEYIIIKDTLEEIDLVKLEISNSFYKSHIIPLANYYDKYL